MKTWHWWTLGIGSVSVATTVALTTDLAPHVEYVPEKTVVVAEDTIPAAPSAYGIPLSGFVLERSTVKNGSTFGDLLGQHGMSPTAVDSGGGPDAIMGSDFPANWRGVLKGPGVGDRYRAGSARNFSMHPWQQK